MDVVAKLRLFAGLRTVEVGIVTITFRILLSKIINIPTTQLSSIRQSDSTQHRDQGLVGMNVQQGRTDVFNQACYLLCVCQVFGASLSGLVF